MNLDELLGQFEAFTDRARAVLGGHIADAHAIVAAANNETGALQNKLIDLRASCKSAQDQLNTVTSDLNRAVAFVGVGHDIEKARAELERVKSETEQATKALELLAKQRSEREAQLLGLQNEVGRLVSLRSESEVVMNNLRSQLRSVTIGVQQ